MSQANKKRRSSIIRRYRIHVLLVVLLAVGVFTAFWPAYVWNSQIDQDVNRLTVEKNRIMQQNQMLQEEVRKLNTPEYIEQLARKDLGLVKPGEIPITQGIPSKR